MLQASYGLCDIVYECSGYILPGCNDAGLRKIPMGFGLGRLGYIGDVLALDISVRHHWVSM